MKLLTVAQVAETLRCHDETVRKLVRSGQLPAFRIGGDRGAIRIRSDDLDKALVAAAENK